MAEIESGRAAKRKTGCIKKSTRVDLTPMVDLGFLLITFFVFTTTMSTHTAMKINMPFDKTIPSDPVCESCVLTVLLEKNDRIIYYEGTAENDPEVKQTEYAPREIRKVLMDKMKTVEKQRGSKAAFILIIKPTAASSFKNFVDMTDEATICNISRYYIDELKKADKQMLEKKL